MTHTIQKLLLAGMFAALGYSIPRLIDYKGAEIRTLEAQARFEEQVGDSEVNHIGRTFCDYALGVNIVDCMRYSSIPSPEYTLCSNEAFDKHKACYREVRETASAQLKRAQK